MAIKIPIVSNLSN